MEIIITQQRSLRERISWKIAYALKPLYFAMRSNRRAWKNDKAALLSYPSGSLGKHLGDFLVRHELDLMPKAEWHDVYHVLFGFETNIRDEACVQFVPLGNDRLSLPYLACTFVSAIFYPEYWSDFYRAFCIGRKAQRFHHLDFEKLLGQNLDELRNNLGIHLTEKGARP